MHDSGAGSLRRPTTNRRLSPPSPGAAERGASDICRTYLAVMDNGDDRGPFMDSSHRHHHGIFKIGIAFSLPNSPAYETRRGTAEVGSCQASAERTGSSVPVVRSNPQAALEHEPTGTKQSKCTVSRGVSEATAGVKLALVCPSCQQDPVTAAGAAAQLQSALGG